jgi:hypothetical protein
MADSYVAHEPAFYRAMKAADPSISIRIPAGSNVVYEWLADFILRALAGAQYDALVWYNYPIRNPISDGAMLYQDRLPQT